MKYNDYIKGRRVCFVGACPNIVNRGLADKIDKYDVVCRTNGSIELILQKHFNRHFGRRCDVLYTNIQYYREMKPLPCHKYKKQGVKWLCMKGVSGQDEKEYAKFMNVRTITDTAHMVNKEIKSATMGAYIIKDILNCEPKELYITGIDFFVSRKPKFEHDNYREYMPGYLPDRIRTQGNEINKNKIEDGHNFAENTKYILTLFEHFSNLKTDEFIYDLLRDITSGNVKQGDVTW